jgi:isocitrate dehydrogenase (NAD+)
MAHQATLIPGDGIGPETTDAARRCIEATGVDIDWDVQEAGIAAWESCGDPLPTEVIESIRRHRVALKGPISTPQGSGYRSANMALRKALGLYAGIRPCKTLDGVPTRFPAIDVVVVRMTSEDLYAGIEFAPDAAETAELRAFIEQTDGTSLPADSGISIKPISAASARRAARVAFEHAAREGRAKVTAVHKATVMRHTDGVFVEAAREVAAEFPRIRFGERLVDAVCHDIVAHPERCDVLLAPMLYGDIISDLCAGLSGGLGMIPGVNLGNENAVFEAAHGSAPRHAGEGRANPIALILTGVMLLDHLGEADAAERLRAAVATVVRDGQTLTYDLRAPGDDRPHASTSEVAEAVIRAMA